MRKIVILGMIIATLLLVGCVENTYVPENQIKDEVIKKPTCIDECSQPICDGLNYIACSVGDDGCKHKQNEKKIKGKCDVECLEDSDCSNEEICSNNKCNEDCPQLSQIDVFEWKPTSGVFNNEFWLNQSYDGKIIDSYNVSWITHIECIKGSEEGENINYWYCGKGLGFLDGYVYLEKTTIDSGGNIIQKVKKKALNVYDENFNFVKTICYS